MMDIEIFDATAEIQKRLAAAGTTALPTNRLNSNRPTYAHGKNNVYGYRYHQGQDFPYPKSKEATFQTALRDADSGASFDP